MVTLYILKPRSKLHGEDKFEFPSKTQMKVFKVENQR